MFVEAKHQSCLLLTSRKRPAALTHLDEQNGAFDALVLTGISRADGVKMLAAHGLSGSDATLERLWHSYAGNPLVLLQVADIIYELFDEDIDEFLQEKVFFCNLDTTSIRFSFDKQPLGDDRI